MYSFAIGSASAQLPEAAKPLDAPEATLERTPNLWLSDSQRQLIRVAKNAIVIWFSSKIGGVIYNADAGGQRLDLVRVRSQVVAAGDIPATSGLMRNAA
jgi:hypothetical protein